MKNAKYLVLFLICIASLTLTAQEKPDLSNSQWDFIQKLGKEVELAPGFLLTGNANGIRFQIKFEYQGEKFYSFVVIKDKIIKAHLFLQNGMGERGNPVLEVKPEINLHLKDLVLKTIDNYSKKA